MSQISGDYIGLSEFEEEMQKQKIEFSNEIYKEMADQAFKWLEKIHYEESWKSYLEWHSKYMKEINDKR